MPEVKRTISITTRFGEIGANQIIAKMNRMKAAIKQQNLEQFAKKFKGLGGVMRMGLQDFKKFDDGTGRLNKGMMKQVGLMGRLGLRVRNLTHGFRGFKMELLGVMFFGMGIQRFFTGLIKPALQAVGIFKLWSAILTILFLPVALKLLDWSIKFMEWLNKNEGWKKFIRWVTIIGAVLGGALFLFGMFGLGIGSLIIAFGAIITPIILAIGAFFTFMASMLSSKIGILALIAAFIGLAPSVSAVGDEAKKQGGIWNMITGVISSVVGKIIRKLDEMWEKFIDSGPVTKFLENMGLSVEAIEKIKNPIATLGDYFRTMWDKFLKGSPKTLKLMEDMGFNAEEMLTPWKHLDTIVPKVIDKISEKIKGLIDDAITKLQESDIGKSFTTFMDETVPRLLEILDSLWKKLKVVYEWAEKVGILKAMKWLAGQAETVLTAGPAEVMTREPRGDVPFTDIFKTDLNWELTGLGWIVRDAIIEGFNAIKGAGGSVVEQTNRLT